MFDNDGTLWCEKPMPIQLDFILRRLVEMAEARPELRERQPWKAAYERDYAWLGALMAEHYAGDDTNVQDAGRRHPGRLRRDQRRGLRGAGRRVPAQRAASDARPRLPGVRLRADGRAARLPGRRTGSPTTSPRAAAATSCDRSARRCTASRASGSSAAAPRFAYTSDDRGGTITHKPEADYLDDGPEKPIRIWSRTGRRPLLAAGNSNGDVPMLAVHPARRQADPAPARPARRRRARVRLHHRRRAGARAGRATAGPSSASRTTGPRCSRRRRHGTAPAAAASPTSPTPVAARSLSAALMCTAAEVRGAASVRPTIPNRAPRTDRDDEDDERVQAQRGAEDERLQDVLQQAVGEEDDDREDQRAGRRPPTRARARTRRCPPPMRRCRGCTR